MEGGRKEDWNGWKEDDVLPRGRLFPFHPPRSDRLCVNVAQAYVNPVGKGCQERQLKEGRRVETG